jgi:hypothetical protein
MAISASSLTANFSTQLTAGSISNLFIQQQEVDFINKIASEYMTKISGQYVYYIQIDVDRTSTNFYGESKEKIVQGNKIKLPATVQQVVKPINDENGIRYSRTLRVGFLSRLNEAYGVNNIFQGNFLEWNKMIYEIINIEKQRMIFGQERFSNFEIICNCVVRE